MLDSALHTDLLQIDEYLHSHVKEVRTLCPLKKTITPFTDFFEYIDETIKEEEQAFFVNQLFLLVQHQVENFPNNIYWDSDYIVGYLVHYLNKNGAVQTKKYTDLLHDILDLFGNKGAICFQYMHDFTYGFDWTRWVKTSAMERDAVGPYDVEFLRYLMKRGGELEALIKEDDAKYGQLEAGEFRNPFTFTRVQKEEILLFEKLAANDYVPLKLWDIDAVPNWDKPYYLVRKAYAKAK